MAVYFVTGNLGGGKSLMSVRRIQMVLERGCPVATNLDLDLRYLVGPQSKKSRVIRIPDKPCLHDFELIGVGNATYDESKNGLIVLDECGTWFNSRSWGDKERQPMIDWLLHSRKLGWDVIFIIQNVALVDKQARLALGEHIVYCRRTDRLNIPIIGSIFKIFCGDKLPLPRIHVAVVKYGLLPSSMTVDTWYSMGSGLFNAYDTKQIFTANYPHGCHTMLPPWYLNYRTFSLRTTEFYMRLTKIVLRRYSKMFVFSAGLIASFLLSLVASYMVDSKSSFKFNQYSYSSDYVFDDKPIFDLDIGSLVADPVDDVSLVAQKNEPDSLPQTSTKYKLSFLRDDKNLRIIFNGSVYSQKTFPYPLVFERLNIFGIIPDTLIAEINTRKIPDNSYPDLPSPSLAKNNY